MSFDLISKEDYYKTVLSFFCGENPLAVSCYDMNYREVLISMFLQNASNSFRGIFKNDDLFCLLRAEKERAKNQLVYDVHFDKETKIEFCIVDNRAFWYCNLEKRLAFFKMNEEKECKKLREYFDKFKQVKVRVTE